MRAILAIAAKDLRLLFRVRSGWFFTFVWPIIIAVLFGTLYSGMGGTPRALGVVVADEDHSASSRQLIEALKKGDELSVLEEGRERALALVRGGKRAAAIVIPAGYGQASDRMFHGAAPKIELWIDPSRKPESAMLQGILFKRKMEGFQAQFNDPKSMRGQIENGLAELKASQWTDDPQRGATERLLNQLLDFYKTGPAKQTGQAKGQAGVQWQPLEIEQHEAVINREGPRTGFDLTFPQGLLWGVIGCMMTFGISFVSERTQGTWMRLRMAPLRRVHLLAGKALACAAAITMVQAMLFAIGRFGFGVVPQSWPLTALAAVSTTLAFVGLMMLVAGFGKTEQAAAGMGWALVMPLSLFGGAMVPLAFMPPWMASLGVISPIRWGILAFEGGIWRGFSLGDMLPPCGILLAIGLVCFVIGTRTLRTE